MRAIEHHLQFVETNIAADRLLNRVNIAAGRVVDPASPADPRCVDQRGPIFHQGFDGEFVRIGQLEAIGSEQLDAVIFERIMTRADHYAQISPKLPRQ